MADRFGIGESLTAFMQECIDSPLPQEVAEKLAEHGYDVPRADREPTPFDDWFERFDDWLERFDDAD